MSDPKYVRVELSKLRELEQLLADPLAFAASQNFPAGRSSDPSVDDHCRRSYSIGWAASLVKGMLTDVGLRPSH